MWSRRLACVLFCERSLFLEGLRLSYIDGTYSHVVNEFPILFGDRRCIPLNPPYRDNVQLVDADKSGANF